MNDLRFLFLGTGTSAGIPSIACKCRACTSDDPRDTRLRTGAALRWKDEVGHPRTVLLDATPDLRQQALRHNLSRCDAVFFTHNHVDHIFGLDELRRFNVVMQQPIDIYADRPTMDALYRVFQHVFDKDANINASFVATLIPEIITPGRPWMVHGLRFTPIRVHHGKQPILGFRIDSEHPEGNEHPLLPLAYCTDTSAIPPETWPYLTGLRTLVLDALRVRHHPTHYNIDQAVSVAGEIGAERTYFVHMSHEVVHAETNEQLPPGVELAHDGLVLGDADAERRAIEEGVFADDPTTDDHFPKK